MIIRSIEDVEAISYGEGVSKRVVIGEKEGAPNFVMRVFDVAPGKTSPYHTHDWEHEVLLLDGKAVIVDHDGLETPAKAMDTVFIPPNEKHCLKNVGEEDLRFVCLVPLKGEDTQ
jgi:quercetin dioxygenase-like cupin family protein